MKLNKKVDVTGVEGKYAKVPEQPNFCDCGVYLLQYAETFMQNPNLYIQLILVGEI